MLKSKKCIKCKSDDIIDMADLKHINYAHSFMVGSIELKTVHLHILMCNNCGYTESWIPDKTDRKKIEDYYLKLEEDNRGN